MRNLTIRRNSCFVGCAMKDQVYIQDEGNSELTIAGVPCRKLGTLTNKEEKTFQIDEQERKIFLIADKLSKDYCYGTVTVPAGQEDVSYSGRHHFVLGSNPFRFDGVEASPEEAAQQKKNGRKGLIIIILAAIVGVLIGMLPSLLSSMDKKADKVFTYEDFRITLNEDFEQGEAEGFFVFYQTKSVIAFAARDDKSLLEEMTLEAYADLAKTANEATGALQTLGNIPWFDFTEESAGQKIYYRAFCYESQEAFWIVYFATPYDNLGLYKDDMTKWAKTVLVGEPA